MKLLQLSAATFALAALVAGSAQAQAPANDVCTGAINLASSFGGAMNTVITTGPYDNTNATTGADDPTTGYQCFGEPTGSGTAPTFDNTLWFTFVGDGELYFIETGQCTPPVPSGSYIDDGDTQIAIYSGTCGNLTPVACNEDGPSSTATQYPAGLNFQTTAGVTYYMIVDGFRYTSGATNALSTGQFCLKVKKLPSVQCNDPSVSPGTTSASTTLLCAGDTLTVTSTGVVAPTVGAVSGVSWIISNAPITGSTDPLNEPSRVATYVVSNPAPSTSTRTLVNDGTLIGTANLPYGTYYWTPVVFGNATQTTPGTAFLSNHTLSPTCTFVGTSVAVNVAAPGAAACLQNNDLCTDAVNLNSSFGGAGNVVITTGPYTNVGATTGADDPTTGYTCFGEGTSANPAPSLENTVWFTFTGDGSEYFIETGQCNPAVPTADYIDFGDTQMAIYSGTCGNLTPVACNEDGPSAGTNNYPAGLTLQTVAGTTYYIMIDGYLDGTTPSIGQFCMKVKKVVNIACTDPTVTVGTSSINAPCIAPGATLSMSSSGVVGPTTGIAGGSWLVSTADISGSANPLTEPSVVAFFGIANPVPASQVINFVNNGAFIGNNIPYGTYYVTRIVFGNATSTVNPPTSLSTVTLDPACTFTGQSHMVEFKAPGQVCTIGLPELVKGGFFINNIYPVPVTNTLNLDVAAEYSSPVTVTVKDVLGREVSSHNFNATAGESNKYSISLNGESAGVYFVTVSNGRHIAVSKFVKE